MKKFCISVFSLVLLFCVTLGFTACDNAEKKGIPDLADCEIGYELPVYPTCEFSYKVNDECTVHIDKITITLTEKKKINPGDSLSEPFYPCTFHVTATGSTDSKFAGKTIYLNLIISEMYKQQYYYEAVIGVDGSIKWDRDQTNWTSSTYVYFYNVVFEL